MRFTKVTYKKFFKIIKSHASKNRLTRLMSEQSRIALITWQKQTEKLPFHKVYSEWQKATNQPRSKDTSFSVTKSKCVLLYPDVIAEIANCASVFIYIHFPFA